VGVRREEGNHAGLRGGQIVVVLASDPDSSTIYQASWKMTGSTQTMRRRSLLRWLRRPSGWGPLALPFYHCRRGLADCRAVFFTRFLFPSLIDVFWRCVEILVTGSMLSDVIATVLRILGGLVGAFVCGSLVALVMARSAAADRFLAPILSLLQGIFLRCPGWCSPSSGFTASNSASSFIMVVTTLPAFTFQVLGLCGRCPRT